MTDTPRATITEGDLARLEQAITDRVSQRKPRMTSADWPEGCLMFIRGVPIYPGKVTTNMPVGWDAAFNPAWEPHVMAVDEATALLDVLEVAYGEGQGPSNGVDLDALIARLCPDPGVLARIAEAWWNQPKPVYDATGHAIDPVPRG